ncbi:phosphodiesterase/alkaline phosphatase D precursor [Geopyxis carbonaria]|nr:phosphodiesterase/alkaline phosphatase D precursor [Geopyxis carbonaria]
MLPLLSAVAFAATLAPAVSASFAANLAYHSPSLHHPELGISIRKVVARHVVPQAHISAAHLNFTHGVASGDPYADSVILWTRVAPLGADNSDSNVTVSGLGGAAPIYDHDNEKYVSVSTSPVCVDWKVRDTAGHKGKKVAGGRVWTSSDVDYTVKVEAGGLKPFTNYWYRFNVCGSSNASPIGRTKTTPEKGAKVDSSVKLAVFSCSNFPFGFFNAYGNSARKDEVDYVVHLGDYIYEYKNGYYGWGDALGRIPQPNKEIFSLYDYRKRLATYRTDLDLLQSHQHFPWIAVWDDHEVADNTWRDGSSELNNTEQSFVSDGGVSVDQRKMNAVRAYFEWMPLRQVEMDDGLRIWRAFAIGDLIDLLMLDTRNYDRSITDLYWNTDYVSTIAGDASRTLMGARQESWFHRRLRESDAAWKIVGNQIVFTHLVVRPNTSTPLNYDQWDGYAAAKNRTLHTLAAGNISDTIFLAGDSHAAWVSDLSYTAPYDAATGAGAVGVEFAGSAISSPSPAGENVTMAEARALSQWLVANNEQLLWQDMFYRGYFEMEVGYESTTARFWGVPTNGKRSGEEKALAEFVVRRGENRVGSGRVAGDVGAAKSGGRVHSL